MNRQSIFLSTAALIASLFIVPTQAKTLEDIQASGKIVIGTDGTFPPFQYFNKGQLSGFEIDIGNEVAKRLGVTPEWKPMSFDSLLAGLNQDRWDIVIASFTVTPERAKSVHFTSPLYCTGGVIVSKNPNVKTVSDLDGKTVAVQTGSIFFQKASDIPGIKQIRNFASDSDARNAMVSGRADAWLSDKFVAKLAIASQPGQGMKIGDFVTTATVASATKNGNDELSLAYDKILADIQADGTYEKISKKWFDEDIRCM